MSAPTPPPARGRRDAGTTLPEVLVAAVMTGTLLAVISAALIVVLRSSTTTTERVSVTGDMAFVDTYFPEDLRSATASNSDPTYQPAGVTLAGTNVLTVTRSSPGAGDHEVSYRYEQDGDEWVLARHEVRGGSVRRNVVARALPAPPDGWDPTQPPTHALDVRSRELMGQNDVSVELGVTFDNGTRFTTAGGGLAEQEYLPSDGSGGFVDPGAPPSRCGGSITLVVDTSGSVPMQNGGKQLQQAAVSFIDAFTGTPVRINVVGFDRGAYQMRPATAGTYIELLNPSGAIDDARQRILAIDDKDGNWPGGSIDPNGDGIHWDQVGSGTNWEDALYQTFFDAGGAGHALSPDLVVLMTDGDPNRTRSGSGDATAAAAAMAEQGRATGARIVGVLVGNKSESSGSVDRLRQVVGTERYDATANDGAGNAQTANYFLAQFSDAAAVLREVMVAECGGTVTLQKRVDDGSGTLSDVPTTSSWTFTTEVGSRTLERSTSSSITFDYPFDEGTFSRTVRIVEQPVAGYALDRVECSSAGVPIGDRVTQPIYDDDDGQQLLGADIELQADEALSCLVISTPS